MIPRGRPVVDAAGAAQLLGISYKTFRNTAVAADPEFPAPVNPGRRKLLYDEAQVRAYAADEPLPKLPTGEHPDDLLDDQETADVLDVAYATIRADRRADRLPEYVDVLGVPHYRRADLARVPTEMRPGRGAGGGRPRK
ncbi:helix-turn-helix transcriptional regulator [Actinoallomurus sp. CA-142502]|uniref:helix-turn-helix transcriptional regulator n=1 Tax=Actinoallomurus sp. CA-142502 TaxID=3239885 RepID=UPI003D907344